MSFPKRVRGLQIILSIKGFYLNLHLLPHHRLTYYIMLDLRYSMQKQILLKLIDIQLKNVLYLTKL